MRRLVLGLLFRRRLLGLRLLLLRRRLLGLRLLLLRRRFLFCLRDLDLFFVLDLDRLFFRLRLRLCAIVVVYI